MLNYYVSLVNLDVPKDVDMTKMAQRAALDYPEDYIADPGFYILLDKDVDERLSRLIREGGTSNARGCLTDAIEKTYEGLGVELKKTMWSPPFTVLYLGDSEFDRMHFKRWKPIAGPFRNWTHPLLLAPYVFEERYWPDFSLKEDRVA